MGMDLTSKFSFMPPLPLEEDAHLSRKMLTGMITYMWSGYKWSWQDSCQTGVSDVPPGVSSYRLTRTDRQGIWGMEVSVCTEKHLESLYKMMAHKLSHPTKSLRYQPFSSVEEWSPRSSDTWQETGAFMGHGWTGLTQLDSPCSMAAGWAHQSNTAHNIYLFVQAITITLWANMFPGGVRAGTQDKELPKAQQTKHSNLSGQLPPRVSAPLPLLWFCHFTEQRGLADGTKVTDQWPLAG